MAEQPPPPLVPDAAAEVVIIGVDPGLRVTGYGVLACTPHSTRLLDYNHVKTDSRAPVEARLQAIHWGVRDALIRHAATELAIELPFFGVNARSALSLGEARGVILLAAAEEHAEVFQYTPAEVKQSIAGYGRSDKQQMQQAIRLQLDLPSIPQPADAADALAIALCHYAQRRTRLLLRGRQ